MESLEGEGWSLVEEVRKLCSHERVGTRHGRVRVGCGELADWCRRMGHRKMAIVAEWCTAAAKSSATVQDWEFRYVERCEGRVG